MKILIAPDKFKDALDAEQVAEAIAAGVRDAAPEADIVMCPLGDGGEGTGRMLARALGAEEMSAEVLDPLGRPRTATWWLHGARGIAVIEMATASGLALLAPDERAAERTTSFGTGQLLEAAREAYVDRVLLCVGGSATVDGGAGCLQGMGAALLDTSEQPIAEPLTGQMLPRVAAIHAPHDWRDVEVEILCDVDNPLIGPRGAAPVFAPQKGADHETVRLLTAHLNRWADVLRRDCGVDVTTLPGGGAAGGLPVALVAAIGARIRPGFDEVARQIDLARRLADCDLCLTGEGRLDDQTSGGKVVAGVTGLATSRGVSTVALVGAVHTRPRQSVDTLAQSIGLENIVVVTPPDTPLPDALAQTAANLRRAAADVMAQRFR